MPVGVVFVSSATARVTPRQTAAPFSSPIFANLSARRALSSSAYLPWLLIFELAIRQMSILEITPVSTYRSWKLTLRPAGKSRLSIAVRS